MEEAHENGGPRKWRQQTAGGGNGHGKTRRQGKKEKRERQKATIRDTRIARPGRSMLGT